MEVLKYLQNKLHVHYAYQRQFAWRFHINLILITDRTQHLHQVNNKTVQGACSHLFYKYKTLNN